MNLILVGAPGAGKGTQGEILSEKLNIKTISTGAMLRAAIKNETEVGKTAKSYIDGGKLVPDEVMINLVKERLAEPDCENGFILDGFPRTTAQAQALTESGVKIDKVLSIEVDDDVIVERLSSRRECSKCGAPYNIVFNRPEVEGKCDKCGGDLIQRSDDNPETIKNRLDVYHTQTEPIKAYYEELGLLVKAYGQVEVKDTTKEVFKALELEV
ncbi:MAG: adenylate kinase [Firmicutes bacterium]|nr:adenylate kinase [Bacillota bacterium]